MKTDLSVISLHISDFGCARLLPDKQLSDTIIGSPGCMAPEILNTEYDPLKADSNTFALFRGFADTCDEVWAFGILLLELLGGNRVTPKITDAVKKNFEASEDKKAKVLFTLFEQCVDRTP